MKRILTLLLTMVMLMASLGTVTIFAENEAETAPSEEIVITPLDTESYHALYAMGFVGDELKDTDKTTLITRAQFIGYLFKLAGYSTNTYKTEDIPFVDVNTQTPYYNEICTMYELGRVNGTEPNKFSPDKHVTYSQACKLIIDVLGYRNYAEVKYGEYPEGYVFMAGELEINEGIKDVKWDSELTAENAVRMLYNAGSAVVFKFAGTDANGNPKYETDGTTLFETRDIYYAEGIMESNGICSIKDDNATLGVSVISGKKFVSADVDLSDLIGQRVKYFYRDDKASQKLLWATVDTRFSNVLDFRAEDLAFASPEYTLTNVVYYEPNGKTESAKINSLAYVIYNNSRCGIPTIDDLKPMTGTMRLIDNNDDEYYDVVIVKEYDNLFVTHIEEENEQIFAKYNKTVDFADYEEVKIIKEGKEVTINDIDNGAIISYLEDKSKTTLYLYPVNESYKSVLKSSEVVRGRTYYNFENGKFRLSNAYKAVLDDPNEYAVSPQLGKNYTFWLDIFGEIAEVQEGAGNLRYALLMSVRKGEEYEEYDVYTRLLLPDNSKITAAIDKRVMVNGRRNTAPEFLADTRLTDADGEFMVQVVQVSLDDEGLLSHLNFASETDEALFPYGYDVSAFSRDYRGTAATVRNQDNYILIDGKYVVTDNSIIFGKWNEMEGSEPYEVVSKGTILSGSYLKDIYDIQPNMEIGVMYREGLYHKHNWQLSAMVVDSIEYVYSDDQEVKRLNGYMSGAYTSYIEEAPGAIPDTIKRGDVVRVSVRNNRLNSVFVELTAEEIKNKTSKVINNPDATPAYTAERAAIFAPLYRMDASTITVVTPPDLVASAGKIITSPNPSLTAFPFTVYDVKNDEIYRGDILDLYRKYTPRANGDVPEETAMAYLRMRYITAKELILMIY